MVGEFLTIVKHSVVLFVCEPARKWWSPELGVNSARQQYFPSVLVFGVVVPSTESELAWPLPLSVLAAADLGPVRLAVAAVRGDLGRRAEEELDRADTDVRAVADGHVVVLRRADRGRRSARVRRRGDRRRNTGGIRRDIQRRHVALEVAVARLTRDRTQIHARRGRARAARMDSRQSGDVESDFEEAARRLGRSVQRVGHRGGIDRHRDARESAVGRAGLPVVRLGGIGAGAVESRRGRSLGGDVEDRAAAAAFRLRRAVGGDIGAGVGDLDGVPLRTGRGRPLPGNEDVEVSADDPTGRVRLREVRLVRRATGGTPRAGVVVVLTRGAVRPALGGRLHADVRRVPVVRTGATGLLCHVAVDLEVARDRTRRRRRSRRCHEDDPERGSGDECRPYQPKPAAPSAAANLLQCAHSGLLLPVAHGQEHAPRPACFRSPSEILEAAALPRALLWASPGPSLGQDPLAKTPGQRAEQGCESPSPAPLRSDELSRSPVG